MMDVHIVHILMMNTSTFVTYDSKNFHFIGSIPEVQLARVPLDNEIIRIYRQIPLQGERSIPPSLQIVLDVGDAPKRVGMKRKAKVFEEVVYAKSKPKQQLRKSKVIVVDVDSEDHMLSNVCIDDDFQIENDTTNISNMMKNTTKPIFNTEILKISTLIPTSNVTTPVAIQTKSKKKLDYVG